MVMISAENTYKAKLGMIGKYTFGNDGNDHQFRKDNDCKH